MASAQSFPWLDAPIREGTNRQAFCYAYPGGTDLTLKNRVLVRELLVYKGIYQHEMAEFQIISADTDAWKVWDPYTPIAINYGVTGNNNWNQNWFVGYLVTPDSDINQQRREPIAQRAMRFTAIGASLLLKEGAATSFSDSTTSNIVQELATAFYLSSNITQTTQLWGQISCTGTYFEFLCDMAMREGYGFFVDGTTLYFLHPMALASQMKNYPIYYSKDAKTKNANAIPTIIEFHSDAAQLQESGLREKAIWNLSGIDSQVGQIFTATDDGSNTFGMPLVAGGLTGQKSAGRYTPPAFDRYGLTESQGAPSLPARSASEARTMVRARSLLNRYTIRADAELIGDARMMPLQLVSLYGMQRRHSGRWLVRSLAHRVVYQNWFSTSVELMRDSDFDPSFKGVSSNKVTYPPAQASVVRGGLWQAQNASTVQAAIPGASAPYAPTNSSGTSAAAAAGSKTGSNSTNPTIVLPTSVTTIANPTEWAQWFLKYLSVTATQVSVNLVRAWQQQEGMWDESLLNDGSYPGGYAVWGAPYMNNPLNIGGWLGSSYSNGSSYTYNGFQVTVLYTSATGDTFSFNGNWANGLSATTQAMQANSSWIGIISALRTGTTTAFFSAVGAWNPGDSSYASGIETIYNAGTYL